MTEKTVYQPVSCEMHSELELAAIRQQPVMLSVIDDKNQSTNSFPAIIKDFIVKNREEFAEISVDGKISLVRLDHILNISQKQN
jgi:transcriptional antiterminator Rof (Rho-off)